MKKLLFFVLITFSTYAFSEFDVQGYKKLKNTDPMKIYVEGIGKGAFLSNVHLVVIGQKPFFCPPSKLAITGENYQRILDDGIKNQNASSSQYIELILIKELINTFPCK